MTGATRAIHWLANAFALDGATGGNPAHIIAPLDGELSDDAAAALARRFAEFTAVVEPGPRGPLHTRFFTPTGGQVPLCGHLALASGAFATRTSGSAADVDLATNWGDVAIHRAAENKIGMHMPPVMVEGQVKVDRAEITQWTSLPDDALEGATTHRSTCGARTLIVTLRHDEMIDLIIPDYAAMVASREATPFDILLIAAADGAPSDGSHGPFMRWHTRVFLPGLAAEDPATGTATSAHAGLMLASGVPYPAWTYSGSYMQAMATDRPCWLMAEARNIDGSIRVTLAGEVSPVREETIDV
jgi:PhzF family phenazine biosynthesis protein